MNRRDGQKTKAELFPPAEPGKKFGLHGLGVVNTMALQVATDELAITIDPRQFVTCIRYHSGKLQGGLKINRLSPYTCMV